MSDVVVRALHPTDTRRLLELIDGLADYEKLPRPDADARRRLATDAVADPPRFRTLVAELGGQVVVPPFDAPWVRMTVITDPQGATFTASMFVPENKDLASEVDPAVRAA